MLQFSIGKRNGMYEWTVFTVGKETTSQVRNVTVTSSINFAFGRGDPMETKAEVLAQIKLMKQWCLHATVVDNTSN